MKLWAAGKREGLGGLQGKDVSWPVRIGHAVLELPWLIRAHNELLFLALFSVRRRG